MKRLFVWPSSIVLLWSQYALAAEITLTAEQYEHLGIQAESLAAVSVPQVAQASAQVLDAASLVALLSDLRAAQVAAVASQSELRRAEQLHAADANMSQKALDAARAQASGDAGRVETLRAQLQSQWGRGVAGMNDSERKRLFDELQDGRTALARAEVQGGLASGLVPQSALLRSLNSDATWNADVLGRVSSIAAPQGTSAAFGPSYLLRIASRDLQPGELLLAELRDPRHETRGVEVPREAVVRWQGQTWVYVVAQADKFERSAVRLGRQTQSGYLLAESTRTASGGVVVDQGVKVVTVGASLFLGLEFSSPSED